MKLPECPTKGVIAPPSALLSPKYVKRYVPAARAHRELSISLSLEGRGNGGLTRRAALDRPREVDRARAEDLRARGVVLARRSTRSRRESNEGKGGRRTVLVRVHWYVVDGCESERTAFHALFTSWSTERNVCSRRKLFCS